MATREGEVFVEEIDVNRDGGQFFCLIAGGAGMAGLVFVLGVTVGRRVEAREHPDVAGAQAGASDPLAALDQVAAEGAAAPEPELTFASTLRGDRDPDALGAVDLSLDRPQPAAKPAAKPVVEAAKPEAAKPVVEAAKPEAAKPVVEAAKPEAAKPVVEAAKPEAAKPALAAAPAQVSADAARFTLHL